MYALAALCFFATQEHSRLKSPLNADDACDAKRSGYAMMKVGKTVAFVIGLGFIVTQVKPEKQHPPTYIGTPVPTSRLDWPCVVLSEVQACCT